MMKILLKITKRDIIFEKKSTKLYCKDLFSAKYRKRIVKPKKGKGSFKKKKNVNLA